MSRGEGDEGIEGEEELTSDDLSVMRDQDEVANGDELLEREGQRRAPRSRVARCGSTYRKGLAKRVAPEAIGVLRVSYSQMTSLWNRTVSRRRTVAHGVRR